MSKYNCEECRFSTNKKTDHNRHIKTKKHLEKVKQSAKLVVKRASNVH